MAIPLRNETDDGRSLLLDGVRVVGFPKGSAAIGVSKANDLGSYTPARGGGGGFVSSPDDAHVLTVNLLATSPSVDLLDGIISAGDPVAASLSNGRQQLAGTLIVTGDADITWEDATQVRSYTLAGSLVGAKGAAGLEVG